ncbi:hypothetical protein ACIA8G_31405 [Lentzea sp. NPDC051213]|uniref:hypothetical protein n=1 Tax=Lentzea sp. NPDC051213 TaxID=3364126 RepID=UPI00379FE695
MLDRERRRAEAWVVLDCTDEVPHPDLLAAGNPATSPVALFRLAAHEDSEVRKAVAARRDLPRRAVERLAEDPVAAVRRALAGRDGGEFSSTT